MFICCKSDYFFDLSYQEKSFFANILILFSSSHRTVRIWLKRDVGNYWPSVCHIMPCKSFTYAADFVMVIPVSKCDAIHIWTCIHVPNYLYTFSLGCQK